jgi:hypothetical protein
MCGYRGGEEGNRQTSVDFDDLSEARVTRSVRQGGNGIESLRSSGGGLIQRVLTRVSFGLVSGEGVGML